MATSENNPFEKSNPIDLIASFEKISCNIFSDAVSGSKYVASEIARMTRWGFLEFLYKKKYSLKV
jgi:hypothetical protein